VHAGLHDRRLGVEIGFVELGEIRDAEQAHAGGELGLEQLEDADDALLAGGGETIAIEPPDADEIGTERDRLDDVGTAADAAVEDDLRLAADRGDDLGQHFERTAPVIDTTFSAVGSASRAARTRSNSLSRNPTW